MRIVLLVLVLVILGAAGYAYYKDPAGCQKLGSDVAADTTAIVGTIKPPYLTPTPVVPATPPAPATPPPPTTYPMGYVATPQAAVPAPAPVATSAAPAPVVPPTLPGNFTDYDQALAAARKSNVPMLILFTGSDWCPYCQKLEQEVLSTSDFTKYTASHFVFLTVDDLRNSPVSDDQKARVAQLEQKFKINAFPTLMIVGTDETEKGRQEGYNPGSGPAAVIGQLDQIAAK